MVCEELVDLVRFDVSVQDGEDCFYRKRGILIVYSCIMTSRWHEDAGYKKIAKNGGVHMVTSHGFYG